MVTCAILTAALSQQGGKNSIPTGAIAVFVSGDVDADDLGATQTARKTQEQDGAVAQASQIMAHGEKIVGEHRLLLPRRLGVLAADSGGHGGDVAVFPIHRKAALGKIPPNPDRRRWMV